MAVNTFVPPDITNSTLWPEPTNAATNYRNQSTAQFTSITNQLNTEVRDKVNAHLAEKTTYLLYVTRAANLTGDQAITIPWLPTAIEIIANNQGIPYEESIGYWDSEDSQTTGRCSASTGKTALGAGSRNQYNVIVDCIKDNTSAFKATVQSVNANTLTLTWVADNTGATTGTIGMFIKLYRH